MTTSIILRVYSITVLLISSAANAPYTFTKSRTYSTNKCFRLGTLQIIPRCPIDECATQCVLWKKCVGISYNRQMTACFLIDDHFNMENATVNDTVCINVDIKEILLPRRSSEDACSRQPCAENEECLVKGKGEENFDCIPKECPESLETKNAIVPYGSRLVGSTNSIRCHEGYTMFGNSSINCEKDGYWSTSDFQCYKNCPTPRLSNAAVTSFNPRLAYNTTAKFICNDGYTALGDLKVTCLSNGQWSDPEFECYPNCPTPSIPNADMMTLATTLAFNTTVTMKCHEGYYNKATESNLFTIICEAAGQWSNAKPCLKYSSYSPTSYTNGPGLTTPDDRITTVSSNSRTTIRYATTPGLTSPDTTLTTESSYSPTTVRYATAPEHTSPDKTKTLSSNSPNTIRYPTASGPTSSDKTITTGSLNSPTTIRYATETGPTSSDKIITTESLNSPTLTYVTEEAPTSPDIMAPTSEYICGAGYYAATAEYSVSQSFEQQSTWANTDLKCFKYCDSLPSIENANLIGRPAQPYTTTSIARYKCNFGYHHSWTFSAVAEYHCNENGEWVGTLNCCLGTHEWSEGDGRCCLIIIGGIIC